MIEYRVPPKSAAGEKNPCLSCLRILFPETPIIETRCVYMNTFRIDHLPSIMMHYLSDYFPTISSECEQIVRTQKQ